jgi:hypothetical protein
MRFLMLVKSCETGAPPPKELVEAMTKDREEAIRAGTLLETGHLASSAQGARVRISGGRLSVVDGPFAESKEVVGGFALLELGSREEAVEAARWLMQRFLELVPGWEGEVEVRQIMEGPN